MKLNLFLDSTESIDFQVKGSPLANELMTIFQEVIDKRESISTVADRVREVPLFFKKMAGPKLMAAIKKYTGIECRNIKYSKTLDMGFACLMDYGDKYGFTANDIINRYSGLEPDALVASYMDSMHLHPKTAEDMQAIANSLNRETGKFGIDQCAKNIKCTMTLYFDPYGSFLIKEMAHQKFEYLTAEEITGVVLHEIGHMVSSLAHSADLCFRIQVYNRSLEYFVKSATRDEKIKFIKAGAAALDPKMADKVAQGFDKCTAVDGANDQGSWVASVFGWFCDAVALALSFLTLIPFVAIIFDLAGYVLKETFPDLFLKSMDPKKHSDFYGLSNQIKVCEQFADEYVAKHGMSRGQVGALNKIWSYAEYSTSFAAMFGGTTKSTLAYYVNKIPFVIMTLLYGDMTGGDGLYDEKTARAQHLLQETCNVFKQHLSPEMADYFMEDYVRTKQLLHNKSAMDRFRDTMGWIRGAFGYVMSSLPAMLISGRFTPEYQKLYNNTEKLISNPLFYRSTKLESLLRK